MSFSLKRSNEVFGSDEDVDDDQLDINSDEDLNYAKELMHEDVQMHLIKHLLYILRNINLK